ncbi:MAG: sigma-70 family RNA polymerase sigma factor [Patescibacteria group bacterium]
MDGEENLIQGAARGESSAFGQLYDLYQPRIYRFVLIKVGQREEAEDLTHQVFLNAWQNMKGYKSRGFPFSSWLYRIARNKVIDFYRTKRESISIDRVDPEIFLAPAIQQFSFDKNIEAEGLARAIQELEPNYQDVVIMRFVEDLTVAETAAALKKSQGSVKVIQHRAIKKLKEILKTD